LETDRRHEAKVEKVVRVDLRNALQE